MEIQNHLDVALQKFNKINKAKLEIEIAKPKTRKLDKITFEFLVKKINESIENFE